jgi:hypothetical protein
MYQTVAREETDEAERCLNKALDTDTFWSSPGVLKIF